MYPWYPHNSYKAIVGNPMNRSLESCVCPPFHVLLRRGDYSALIRQENNPCLEEILDIIYSGPLTLELIEEILKSKLIEVEDYLRHCMLSKPYLYVLHMKGEPRSLSYSPRGEYMAVGSSGGTVYIWDTRAWGNPNTLRVGEGLKFVAYSPDGVYMAVGSSDGKVRIWDTRTWEDPSILQAGGPVRSIAYSPDGMHLAAGSEDDKVYIWDTRTQKEAFRLESEGIKVSVAYNPTGGYVAAGSGNGDVSIWNTGEGEEVGVLQAGGVVNSVSYSPNGRYLAVGCWVEPLSGKVLLLDTSTREERSLDVRRPVLSVSYSPGGQYLVAGLLDGGVYIWDTRTWQAPYILNVGGPAYSVAYSPVGEQLAVGSLEDNEGAVYIWRGVDLQEIAPGYGQILFLCLLYCLYHPEDKVMKIDEFAQSIFDRYVGRYNEPPPSWLNLISIYYGFSQEMKKVLFRCFKVKP